MMLEGKLVAANGYTSFASSDADFLAKLEQEGLVRSNANRGFFVCGLLREEAEEVYELRLKLEPEALRSASDTSSRSRGEAATSR